MLIKPYFLQKMIETCLKNIESGTAKLIDGNLIAKTIQDELKLEIKKWIGANKKKPCLRAVLVGDDPASCTYVNNKMARAAEVGIDSDTIRLPPTISQKDLLEKIHQLNDDDYVDAILIQLPVPEHISERDVCNAVHVDKDVDGFHVANMGKLSANMDTFVPATSLAVIEIIRRIGIETVGKRAVVVGRSKNVGLPIFQILHADEKNGLPGLEATTVMCHRNTPQKDLAMYCREADIVVSATGVPSLIKGDYIKPGACVIDVGITRITTPEGKVKLVGDVDFDACKNVAGLITPVPRGVGPVTVAMLMFNTFKACKLLAKMREEA